MGDIWSHDKLLLFLAFFVPGFISMQIYSMIVPSAPRDFMKSLPEAVGYSAIYYALFGWVLFLVHGIWFIAVFYVIMLVIPILGTVAWLSLRDWKTYCRKLLRWRTSESHTSLEADPWDTFFSRYGAHEKWIRIALKDGTTVGGYFGKGSNVSTYPHPHELYVSQQWEFDSNGLPAAKVPGTHGFIVSADEIKLVEIFEDLR